ncbi:MarR family transcriptional regulator [Kitasatospora sp. NPDC048296]|uniref:MarR family transcriptional regulator n=1 Tax=Kitasatospora sp. NPDC048296 TaxID=3364048 RepID=UPI0037225717
MSQLHFAAVNCDGIVADLDMGPAAYRILLKLRAHSEAGGRIDMDQAGIAQLVGIARTTVIAGMRDLLLARLLTRVRNGNYKLNAMIAGYRSPEDAVAAVAVMPAEERLTHPDFVKNYREAAAQYQDQLAEQRKKRAKAAAAKKAAAERSRRRLHAVG